MYLLTKNPLTGQSKKVKNRIQAILDKQQFWPVKRVCLFYN